MQWREYNCVTATQSTLQRCVRKYMVVHIKEFNPTLFELNDPLDKSDTFLEWVEILLLHGSAVHCFNFVSVSSWKTHCDLLVTVRVSFRLCVQEICCIKYSGKIVDEFIRDLEKTSRQNLTNVELRNASILIRLAKVAQW